MEQRIYARDNFISRYELFLTVRLAQGQRLVGMNKGMDKSERSNTIHVTSFHENGNGN